jgi:hypothetical protein
MIDPAWRSMNLLSNSSPDASAIASPLPLTLAPGVPAVHDCACPHGNSWPDFYLRPVVRMISCPGQGGTPCSAMYGLIE